MSASRRIIAGSRHEEAAAEAYRKAVENILISQVEQGISHRLMMRVLGVDTHLYHNWRSDKKIPRWENFLRWCEKSNMRMVLKLPGATSIIYEYDKVAFLLWQERERHEDFSRRQLSLELCVTRDTIRRWECGESTVCILVAFAWAIALGGELCVEKKPDA